MEHETQENQINLTAQSAEAQSEAGSQNAAGTELNINDLAAMKMIVDIASSRGAFKPAEMMAVGQTYNKLTAFLNAVSKGASNGS
jgi:hypothetical protein